MHKIFLVNIVKDYFAKPQNALAHYNIVSYLVIVIFWFEIALERVYETAYFIQSLQKQAKLKILGSKPMANLSKIIKIWNI